MVLPTLIKRLVGNDEAPQISDNPFGDKEVTLTGSSSPVAEQNSSVVMLRDEIIDSRGRIAGYRFRACTPQGRAAFPAELAEALQAEAVASLAQRRIALVPVAMQAWDANLFARFSAPGTTYLLEPRANGDPDENWSTTTSAVDNGGARYALRSDPLPAAAKPLLPGARLLLLDFAAYPLNRFEEVVKLLRERLPQLPLAADNVSTWPERRLCMSLGVEYCLGGFATTQDEEHQQEGISESRLVLIEMLNQLRNDAELTELAQIAKRDPGVSLQMVALANAPMMGLSSPVASLDQAMMVLGREYLYRWLTVSLFRVQSDRDTDESLLELALTRARLLELVGQSIGRPKTDCAELFLVGMLSVVDALFGMPMEQVLKHMYLPEAVQDVLLRSEGPFGRYLMLAIAMEKGRAEQATQLAQSLTLDFATLQQQSHAALAWAEDAMAMSNG